MALIFLYECSEACSPHIEEVHGPVLNILINSNDVFLREKLFHQINILCPAEHCELHLVGPTWLISLSSKEFIMMEKRMKCLRKNGREKRVKWMKHELHRTVGDCRTSSDMFLNPLNSDLLQEKCIWICSQIIGHNILPTYYPFLQAITETHHHFHELTQDPQPQWWVQLHICLYLY